ncbi:MAG: sigma-70 family RNA polymerase sigma factor [Bacteroidia bacterium]|nr:sigma-70 family RNA polymerase sigma factor [Bacteroidia bacterium]
MKNTMPGVFPAEKILLEDIFAGGYREEAAIRQIYCRCFPPITKMIRSRGGNEADGEDIFQEALLVLYQKIKSGNFELHSRLVSYLMAVAANIWSKRLRKLGRESFPDSWADDIGWEETPDFLPEIIEVHKPEHILNQMNHLTEDCREILRATVLENQSMKTIRIRMGYQNEQVARNKKCRCLGYLRKLLQEI